MPNDRNDRRPIPPPPDDTDAELEAAWSEVEKPKASPGRSRDEFARARRRLVDLYCAASGGRIDYTTFNDVSLDDFDAVAAEHGVRLWTDAIDETRRLREAVVHEVSQRHRHVAAEDLSDLIDSPSFDYESVTGRAAQIEQERSESARDMLVSAMAAAGVDTSAEDFDPVAALGMIANPKAAAPPELPEDPLRSTPMSRSASLPHGTPFSGDFGDKFDHLHGEQLIEAAADEFLKKMKP